MSTSLSDNCHYCGTIFAQLASEEWRTEAGEPIIVPRSSALYAVASTSIGTVCICEPCLRERRFEEMGDVDQAEVLYQFGLEYRDSGRTSDSLTILKRAVRHSPQSKILGALAFAYETEGQLATAINLYREAVSRDPKNGMAAANLERLSNRSSSAS
jgi:tetratricopeptide (TPR) repeat protein